MNVIIIQPPIMQLNTPYPSGAYLSAFFKQAGCNVKWLDLNNMLFHALFCRDGLLKLFSLTQEDAQKKARDAFKNHDDATYKNICAYCSMSSAWADWIDDIVHILQDGETTSSREICHRFVFAPDVPRGERMNAYLQNLDHDLSTDDARFLASLAIADLADYITAVFDPAFSLVRYAESVVLDSADFAQIERAVDSPLLVHFYDDILKQVSTQYLKSAQPGTCKNECETLNEKTLICISVPFAGTFSAALYTGRFFKTHYKNDVFICAGGGFINTELRDCSEAALYKYFDAFSYDRGYAGYTDILLRKDIPLNKSDAFYNMRRFTKEGVIAPRQNDAALQKKEDALTSKIIPDFFDIDFSQYPRMIDDTNPMQRMWSDGSWIKAYLAHGCYWHKCAFCDTTLDYVKSYLMTDVQNLFFGLMNQCENKKVYGLHFVDEALPPAALKHFALLNAQNKNRLSFWGNVRFEKSYTRDAADLLSYGGLIGVSGGIEIATGSGLDKINKGTDLDSIVSACCAFKEAGILVHAYMIFGYWNETPQDLINSMETLRQFYEEGLLDSSFWHKFTLTKHSTVYDEWKKGLHKDLVPVEKTHTDFLCGSTIHFKGENSWNKFSRGLNVALQNWMHGEEVHANVNQWFDFKTPTATVPRNLIKKSIARYEKFRDEAFAQKSFDASKMHWLGGKLFVQDDVFLWTYKGELLEQKVPCKTTGEQAANFAKKINLLLPAAGDEKVTFTSDAHLLELFRGRGLCVL